MPRQIRSVDVEELRLHLDELLDSPDTVHITRDGELLGTFLPAFVHPTQEEIQAVRDANAELRMIMERAGLTEDDVIREFQALRKAR